MKRKRLQPQRPPSYWGWRLLIRTIRWTARPDTVALILLALGLASCLAVLSFDPADPPLPTSKPAHTEATNFVGLPGAWAAQLLIGNLGYAVYMLLATWFVAVLAILQRGSP